MVNNTFSSWDIAKLIIAIILGYSTLFFFMWLFRDKKEKIKE
jgi:multisubunit Na+/H+ antiporter MnhB subunit